MTLEQLLILRWFVIPVAVILLAIPVVFIYAYLSEWLKRRAAGRKKRSLCRMALNSISNVSIVVRCLNIMATSGDAGAVISARPQHGARLTLPQRLILRRKSRSKHE